MSEILINQALENKLKPEDIILASEATKELARKQELTIDLCARKGCDNCPLRKLGTMTLPQGNIHSPLMIIGDYPSKEDSFVRMPFYDAGGRLLTLILEKLNMPREKVYVTNIIKCHADTSIQENAVYDCTGRFLMREIGAVKPKVILSLGENTAKTIHALCIDQTVYAPPLQELRGKEFKANQALYFETKAGIWTEEKPVVIFSYHPREVLSKPGSMYNKYKLDLWNDVKNAVIKAIS